MVGWRHRVPTESCCLVRLEEKAHVWVLGQERRRRGDRRKDVVGTELGGNRWMEQLDKGRDSVPRLTLALNQVSVTQSSFLSDLV